MSIRGLLRRRVSGSVMFSALLLAAGLSIVAPATGARQAAGQPSRTDQPPLTGSSPRTGQAPRTLSGRATAARVLSLNENGSLHINKSHGSKIEASGSVTGTIAGGISARLTVNSASRLTAAFVVSSHSGSLSGEGVSEYGVSGSTIYFTGSVRITRGTGSYAHAHASSIHVEGTVNRKQKRITMKISGRLTV